jgi:hypothetical protein
MTKRFRVPFAAAILLLAACSDRETTCPAADQIVCGDACVAVRSDPLNCGACGVACGTGQACQSGACLDCAGGACAADVFAACFNSDEVRGATNNLLPAGGSLATDDGPTSLVRLGDRLVAVNSIENTLSVFALGGAGPAPAVRVPVPGTASGFGDLQHAAVREGLVYVVNSSASTLVALDPVAGTSVAEIALTDQPFAFPQSLDFVGGKAYVSLNGANAVAVVDVSTMPWRLVKTVDVSGLAAVGAAAMPARVRAAGARVLVTLNHLSPTTFTPIAGANGRLAVIDPATDALDPAQPFVDLGEGCKNPSDLAVEGGTLWVTCGYYDFFGARAVQGGGFAPVALATPLVAGSVVATTQAPGSLAFCGGRGYAGDVASGTLLRLDPVTREVTAAPGLCPANVSGNAFVADVECAR